MAGACDKSAMTQVILATMGESLQPSAVSVTLCSISGAPGFIWLSDNYLSPLRKALQEKDVEAASPSSSFPCKKTAPTTHGWHSKESISNTWWL